MITLIAAALAAAQPTTAAAANPSPNARAQHQEMGHMGMTEKEMADCHKCCEEMMAKMHEGHPKHGEHKPR